MRLPVRTTPETGAQIRETDSWWRRNRHASPNLFADELAASFNVIGLSQLRKARGLTQEAMAELLGVSQAEVSKMERRSELYIGTLKKFIEAMNGELVLAARFADGVEVPIKLAEDAA